MAKVVLGVTGEKATFLFLCLGPINPGAVLSLEDDLEELSPDVKVGHHLSFLLRNSGLIWCVYNLNDD